MVGTNADSTSAIKISGKSFTWGIKIKEPKKDDEKKKDEKKVEEKEEKPEIQKLADLIHLKNIEIDIKKGEFVCIIGDIGSGKTNLFSAILGDMLNINDESIKILGGQDREFKNDEERKIFM